MMYAAAAAISLGIMRGSFDYALAYSNEREQGGCPIVNWSMIKTILADMAIQMKIGDMAVSGACSAIEKKMAGWDLCAKTAALSCPGCRLPGDHRGHTGPGRVRLHEGLRPGKAVP